MFIDNTKNKNILKPNLSNEGNRVNSKDNPAFLKAFLFTDYEIEKVKKGIYEIRKS